MDRSYFSLFYDDGTLTYFSDLICLSGKDVFVLEFYATHRSSIVSSSGTRFFTVTARAAETFIIGSERDLNPNFLFFFWSGLPLSGVRDFWNSNLFSPLNFYHFHSKLEVFQLVEANKKLFSMKSKWLYFLALRWFSCIDLGWTDFHSRRFIKKSRLVWDLENKISVLHLTLNITASNGLKNFFCCLITNFLPELCVSLQKTIQWSFLLKFHWNGGNAEVHKETLLVVRRGRGCRRARGRNVYRHRFFRPNERRLLWLWGRLLFVLILLDVFQI